MEQNQISSGERGVQPKSYKVVATEIKEMLEDYMEKHNVPFAWEAKILNDIVNAAVYDQFSTHEEDIIELQNEIKRLRGEE